VDQIKGMERIRKEWEIGDSEGKERSREMK
jgi:hypothetical protein